jgi:hypothetical protein
VGLKYIRNYEKMLSQKQINEIVDSGHIIYCFDIDDTICNMESLKLYTPIKERIDYINKQYHKGHYIYLYTCRKKNGTSKLLDKFGLKYNEIVYGKPKAHIYIDDSAVNSEDYWEEPEFYDRTYKKYGNAINKLVRKWIK